MASAAVSKLPARRQQQDAVQDLGLGHARQIDDDPPGGIVEGIHPRKVANPGALVHIHGSGFNAIEGYEPNNVTCSNLGNSCSPLRGTCVEFKDASGLFQPAEVVAITPTYIAVRAPFACSRPADVRIRRLGMGGTFELENAFCRN